MGERRRERRGRPNGQGGAGCQDEEHRRVLGHHRGEGRRGGEHHRDAEHQVEEHRQVLEQRHQVSEQGRHVVSGHLSAEEHLKDEGHRMVLVRHQAGELPTDDHRGEDLGQQQLGHPLPHQHLDPRTWLPQLRRQPQRLGSSPLQNLTSSLQS